jgi:ssDNA-binding replication factor A large subunit
MSMRSGGVSQILESKEEIVQRIMDRSPGMAKEELESRIKEKQDRYGGLLTEAGAAYAIARELGIDVTTVEKSQSTLSRAAEVVQRMKIKELRDGLDGVDVVGVVEQVFAPRRWQKEGRSGKVCNLTLMDDTGKIRLALWHNDVDLVESGRIQRGTVLEVRNGFVKKSQQQQQQQQQGLDLSLGLRGRLIVNPDDAPGELPEVEHEVLKLKDIKDGMDDFDCYVRTKICFQPREFEREKDGSRGKVANCIISDGTTDEIRLVLWNDHAAWAGRLKRNDILKVEGAYVKNDINGKPELHAGWRTHIIWNPDDVPAAIPEFEKPEVERKTIAELNEGDSYVEVKAKISRVFPFTLLEICPECGKKVSQHCDDCKANSIFTPIINAEIDDDTAVIRAVFYRDRAEEFLGLRGLEIMNTPELFNRKVESLVGKEFLLSGNVKLNSVFNVNELVVREIKGIVGEEV